MFVELIDKCLSARSFLHDQREERSAPRPPLPRRPHRNVERGSQECL